MKEDNPPLSPTSFFYGVGGREEIWQLFSVFSVCWERSRFFDRRSSATAAQWRQVHKNTLIQPHFFWRLSVNKPSILQLTSWPLQGWSVRSVVFNLILLCFSLESKMFCASRRCGLDVDPSMCIVRCFVLPPWRWVGEAEICWLVFATDLLWRNWQYVDFFFCRAFGDHEADDMLSRFCRLKNLGYVDIFCWYGNISTGLHHSFADREICRLAYASCRESLPTFLLLSHVCWWMVVRYRTYRLSLRRIFFFLCGKTTEAVTSAMRDVAGEFCKQESGWFASIMVTVKCRSGPNFTVYSGTAGQWQEISTLMGL